MSKFIKFELVSYEGTQSFGSNQENRQYNHAHLDKIKKQFLTSFEVIPPITVNILTNHVIDGQHRLRAYQNLIADGILTPDNKIKVMWVEIPLDEEKEAIINANTNSKNWSLDDYIGSYIKAGVQPYVKLNEWCKLHTLTTENGKSKFRYGAAIISGKRCQVPLMNGDFNFTDEDLARAEEVHAEMLEIVELFQLKNKGYWIEALAVCWIPVRKKHDFKTWMREFKSKKTTYIKLPKTNSKEWNNIFAQAHLAIDKKKEN